MYVYVYIYIYMHIYSCEKKGQRNGVLKKTV